MVIWNRGSETDEVRSIETGCGCLRASLVGAPTVPPGESRHIELVVNTLSQFGRISKTVRVSFAKAPTRSLAVDLSVIEGLVLSSQVIDLGRHAVGRAGVGSLLLLCPDSDPGWSIRGIVGPTGPITFSCEAVESTVPGALARRLTVRRPGESKPQVLEEEWHMLTSRSDAADVLLRARLTVVERFFALPASVGFGLQHAAAAARVRRVRIVGGEQGDEPQVSGAIVHGSTAFTCRVLGVRDGACVIEVCYARSELLEGAGGGSLDAELMVTLASGDCPAVRVPLHVWELRPKEAK